ncbi:MAG: hypothetical protein WC157_02735 [Candidatus Paceibacterota bacterium]
MSFEIIAFIIMVLSFLGMFVIATRRLEEIASLPNSSIFNDHLKEKVQKETRDIVKKQYFSIQILAQKLLSRFRIFILRLDTTIFNLNLKLKEKSKKTKEDIDLELTDIKKRFKKNK